MYKPNYFTLREVLPQNFYANYKPVRGDKLWLLFDPRVLITADRIRERYGKMVANTWAWRGSHNFRGYRPANTEVGAEFSQHKFGRALDLVPIEVEVEEIRRDIIAQPNRETFKHITAIELNVSWLHFDTRNWNKNENGLLTFKP